MKQMMISRKYASALIVTCITLPHTVYADELFSDWSRTFKDWKQTHLHNTLDKVTDKEKWDIRLGAGIGFIPEYVGSDETKIAPLPNLDITWNDTLFFNHDGLGAYLYHANNLEVTGAIGYAGKRDQDDHADLRGLGDVDGAMTANFGIRYALGPISPYAKVSKHLGGTNSLEVQFGIQSMIPLSLLTGKMSLSELKETEEGPHMGPALMFGISTDWGDDNYMENYFGVNALQSTRSGLTQYTASSGFKTVNFDIGVMYPITDRWTANAQLGYSRFVGDATDSPIVKQDNQVFGGLFVAYEF